MDKVEEFVNGRSCREVANVDSAAGGVIGGIEGGRKGRSRVVARRRKAKRGRSWSIVTLLLCIRFIYVSVFQRIRKTIGAYTKARNLVTVRETT